MLDLPDHECSNTGDRFGCNCSLPVSLIKVYGGEITDYIKKGKKSENKEGLVSCFSRVPLEGELLTDVDHTKDKTRF